MREILNKGEVATYLESGCFPYRRLLGHLVLFSLVSLLSNFPLLLSSGMSRSTKQHEWQLRAYVQGAIWEPLSAPVS